MEKNKSDPYPIPIITDVKCYMRSLYFKLQRSPAAANPWSSRDHQVDAALLLQSCSTRKQLSQIHAHMIRTRVVEDTFAASRIITLLTSPSSLFNMVDARRVLDQTPRPNLFMWNAIIRGFTYLHAPLDALSTFKLLLRRGGLPPDSYTFSVATKACAQLGSLHTGSGVHGLVAKLGFQSDMFVMSGFISFYSCCGEVDIARKVFDKMPEKDVVSWTSMISGYSQRNQLAVGFILFDEMRKAGIQPNKITVMSLLSACGQSQDLGRGCWIHSQIMELGWESDLNIGNSLVSMYAKCGSAAAALAAFKSMPAISTATWKYLIVGFVHSGQFQQALDAYQEMRCCNARPDEVTIASALSACAQLGDLQQGKLLHAFVEDNMLACDVFLGNALINMYAKCGDLPKAASVFQKMPWRDVYSWTAMIAGCVQGNRCREALSLFEEMKLSNVEANEVTMVCLLSACSQLCALEQGRSIHAYIEENEVRKDICLQNALIDMYAKCGCADVAMQIFEGMPCKDAHTWNAMIGGLAANGHGREAVSLFDQMCDRRDVKPDGVTLVAVLWACNHSGLVSEGISYFDSMFGLYGIVPKLEHYGCLIDLLSRAGFVDEAIDLIKRMPMAPNYLIWGSLLAACRTHGKMELAEKIAENIVKLKPDEEGAHVLISNLYAEACRWDEVGQVRELMRSTGTAKSPGCSSIEVNGVIREFFVGDTSVQ